MPRMSRMSPRVRAERQAVRDAANRRIRNEGSTFEAAIADFETHLKSLTLEVCPICQKRAWSTEITSGGCKTCRTARGDTLFSAENGMDFGLVPPELKDLTLVEQLLIARVNPVVSVFKIRGQQTAYSGHTMNFAQNLSGIASRLPPDVRSLNSVILLNRETPSGVIAFRVRAARVRRALYWLKQNNQYYYDVIIDNEALNNLPEDGDVSGLLPTVETEANDRNPQPPSDEIHNNILTSSCFPNVPAQDAASAIDRELQRLQTQSTQSTRDGGDWPSQNPEALNEFRDEGIICRAFPCLFPFGRGDLRAPRVKTITTHKYFQYLMDYHDGRFANDTRFPYYAYNSMVRWDAINSGNVYIRQAAVGNMSAAELRAMAHSEDENIANQIMYYGSSLRGTRSFWQQRSSEIDQMVRQLGSPTIFITLSAADYHWPDLFQLLRPGVDPLTLSEKERATLMHANPLITAKYFETRCDVFMEKFLKKIFKIKDYWYRFEWQHRGSPHIHGLLWLDGAPDCSAIGDLDEEGKAQIISYFDQHVSAQIGNRVMVPAREIPPRYRYTDLADNLKPLDLDRILSTVQGHLKCTPACLRKRKNSNVIECRFKFPQPLEEQSSLRLEDGMWKFIPKRNDELLARYNKFVSLAWRGNTDFSAITSLDAVLRYIAKYASKGEFPSEDYSSILKRVTSNASDDDSAATLIRQLMISSVAERNFSSQEVMHLIMGWPLYHASRSFIILSTDDRWSRIDNRYVQGNLIQAYSRRQELDDLTLLGFAKRYRLEGQVIKERTKDVIVRVLPYLKATGNIEADERYYLQQCKVHLPWRGDFEDMLPADSTWEELYFTRSDEIEANNDELNLDQPLLDDVEYEDNEYDHAIIHRDAGMAAARIHPAAPPTDRLGHRPIDEACIWPDETSANLSYEEVSEFLRTYKNAPGVARGRGDSVPYETMSPGQQQVVDLCREQLNNPDYPTKRVLVQGKAGTGKSAIIKAMCAMLDSQRDPNHTTYEILAPTGAAAINVDGKTIHSYFSIPCSGTFKDLAGEPLRKFQLKTRHLRFIIIDEYSMVGMRMLVKIHKRLQQARPGSGDEPFGGLNVYLFGDLRQLPPVKDTALYMDAKDAFSAIAKVLLRSLQVKLELTVCHRQSDDQVVFKRILDNLSIGKSTHEDWEVLMRRRAHVNPSNSNTFAKTIHLYPTNAEVDAYNLEQLTGCGKPAAVILAENNNAIARLGKDQDAQGLPKELSLCIGARIMLKKNLDVSRGLVNGSLGYIREIIYKPGQAPPELPSVILIEFDHYQGPFIRGNCFPLRPIKVNWKERGAECNRTQFPITPAFAVTIHKSQGLTLDKVTINIGDREQSPGMTYVGLSRARRLEDIIFIQGFNRARITELHKMVHVVAREKFLSNFIVPQ